MIAEPEFLTIDDVVDIHNWQLSRYGGSPGIRELISLESAIAVPKSTFDGAFLHVDLFDMGAAYAFHIAENQPFIDGNKRTGLLSALVFLDINGIKLGQPSFKLFEIMIDIAAKTADKTRIAELFRSLASDNQ